MPSLMLSLEIQFGINNSTWDKSENWGRVLIVDYDTSNNCRLYATTMKAMSLQDSIPSLPIDKFKDHNVLAFDLKSMQDETEHWNYPELVGEPLRLGLKFTFAPEHATVWEN